MPQDSPVIQAFQAPKATRDLRAPKDPWVFPVTEESRGTMEPEGRQEKRAIKEMRVSKAKKENAGRREREARKGCPGSLD